jgi:hypothetical protein
MKVFAALEGLPVTRNDDLLKVSLDVCAGRKAKIQIQGGVPKLYDGIAQLAERFVLGYFCQREVPAVWVASSMLTK